MAFQNRKKYCYFKENGITEIDYNDVKLLRRFINDEGKIMPRRVTGTSAAGPVVCPSLFRLVIKEASLKKKRREELARRMVGKLVPPSPCPATLRKLALGASWSCCVSHPL